MAPHHKKVSSHQCKGSNNTHHVCPVCTKEIGAGGSGGTTGAGGSGGSATGAGGNGGSTIGAGGSGALWIYDI